MTKQGKYNVYAMLLLPLAAAVGVKLAANNGVFNPLTGSMNPLDNTYLFVMLLNLVVTVPAALISGILLLRSGGDTSRWIAILPTAVPALWGAAWYLWRGVSPAVVAPGAEYIGAMQYLMVAMVVVLFIVLLVRVTRIIPRTA